MSMKKVMQRVVLTLLVCLLSLSPMSGNADTVRTNNLKGWDGKSYQYVLFGHYRQQFPNEAILWRVLDVYQNQALLLSELILDTRPFDDESNVWIDSGLYQWLNSDFFSAAFSRQEQAAILYGPDLGYVFLLSKGEMTNAKYGFIAKADSPDPHRSAVGSVAAIENNLWVSSIGGSSYYLRSVPNKSNVDQIRSNGSVGVARIDRDNVGIRPAIFVDLDQLNLTFGRGSFDFPFQSATE